MVRGGAIFGGMFAILVIFGIFGGRLAIFGMLDMVGGILAIFDMIGGIFIFDIFGGRLAIFGMFWIVGMLGRFGMFGDKFGGMLGLMGMGLIEFSVFAGGPWYTGERGFNPGT